VGIEFARLHARNRVIAVERDSARAARIRRNAARLGVPGVDVVEGASADQLQTLPSPDAVFIGGGATSDVVSRVWQRLRPGGRLVVHGVTVETEAVLVAAHRQHGGALSRIAVEDLEPLGRFGGWRPSRAVTQWAVVKPRQPVGAGTHSDQIPSRPGTHDTTAEEPS
jgi:precorrin-6Y C5,15-methyltransferase (decarboxylating)